MNNTSSFHYRLCPSVVFWHATVILLAFAWSDLTFCGAQETESGLTNKAPLLSPSTQSNSAAQPPKPDVIKPEENEAWSHANALDAVSLQAFLKLFPAGQHAQEANTYLKMLEKMADIKSGKPYSHEEIIMNSQLGATWESWKTIITETKTGGVLVEQKDADTWIGVFRPIGGGATPGQVYYPSMNLFASFDKTVYLVKVPADKTPADMYYDGTILPTGEGSIVGIKTGGWKIHYIGLTFETAKDSQLVFGVIRNLGLVHLGGSGNVTLTNGTILTFK